MKDLSNSILSTLATSPVTEPEAPQIRLLKRKLKVELAEKNGDKKMETTSQKIIIVISSPVQSISMYLVSLNIELTRFSSFG